MIALWAALAWADEPAWRPVVDTPAYPFCQVDGVDRAEVLPWCPLLDELPADACPGLRATCAGAPDGGRTTDRGGCEGGLPGGEVGRGFSAPPDASSVTPASCDQTPPEAPDLGASVLRWVVAIAVAGLVLAIGRALWRTFGRAKPPPAPVTRAAPPAVVSDPEAAEHGPAAGGDLLDAARAALAAGRPGDAVLLARAAALRSLAERGRLRLDPSRTDREYVRSVRGQPAEPGLREVVGVVEGQRWGGRAVDAEAAERAIAAAARAIGAAVALLVALAAPGDAAAARYGPEGDAALLAIFARGGYDASWRLRGLDGLEDDLDVLVLDAEVVTLDDQDLASLRTWVAAGGVLVVAGDLPDPFVEIGLRHELEPAPALLGPDAPVGLPVPRWPGGPAVVFDDATSAQAWVVRPDGGRVVVAASIGAGGVIAVADGRLLENAALLSRQNEGFLLAAPLMGADAGRWALPGSPRLQIATRSGRDATSPTSSLWSSRLMPFLLQLLVVGAAGAWWRGWPFAPLREPNGGERASFAEHLRALGLRYARAGAVGRAFALSGGWWLDRLGRDRFLAAAARAGLPPGRGEALADAITAARVDLTTARATTHDLEDLWKLTRHR